MENIIWFEFNNWFAGVHFPDEEPYLSWMYPTYDKDKDLSISLFMDEAFVNKNKLAVYYYSIDMSDDYVVGATESWIMKNCPNLLDKHKKFVIGKSKVGEQVELVAPNINDYYEKSITVTYDDNTAGKITILHRWIDG